MPVGSEGLETTCSVVGSERFEQLRPLGLGHVLPVSTDKHLVGAGLDANPDFSNIPERAPRLRLDRSQPSVNGLCGHTPDAVSGAIGV